MKALVYVGPKTLEIHEREDLKASGDNNLIRVDAVGICGSDMHAYLGHDERRPALEEAACGGAAGGALRGPGGRARAPDRRVHR